MEENFKEFIEEYIGAGHDMNKFALTNPYHMQPQQEYLSVKYG